MRRLRSFSKFSSRRLAAIEVIIVRFSEDETILKDLVCLQHVEAEKTVETSVRGPRAEGHLGYNAVSYTHLTLPTILLV